MAFFLLGRDGDTLNLLCPETFATRQDALNALSRVTAKPEFDQWNAEVLLLDTDAGMPVLLVRPNAFAGEPAQAEEPVEELEVVVFDELDEVPAAEEAPAEETPAAEEVPAAVGDAAIADEIVDEFEAEEAAASANALRDALARTAVQMESEGIFAPESIGSAQEESGFPTGDETVTEFVVEFAPAPEIEPEVESAPAAEPASESAPAGEPASESAPEIEPVLATELPEEETAPESPEAAWPWDAVADAAEPADTALPEAVTDTADTAPERAEYVLSDLEEPSLDDGSILRGSIDDDTFAAARPVIMGSYSDTPPRVFESEPVPDLAIQPETAADLAIQPETAADLVVEPETIADLVIAPEPEPLTELVAEPMGIADFGSIPPAPVAPFGGFAVPVVGDAADIFPVDLETPESVDEASVGSDEVEVVELLTEQDDSAEEPEAVASESGSESAISDFILDLDAIPAGVDVVAAPGAAALDEYTCADCIYEATCPNKDQRHPKDCGSFQWR